MFIVAYFGIRPFQITDGTGEYSFGDYLEHRNITCIMALAAGAVFLTFMHGGALPGGQMHDSHSACHIQGNRWVC